MKSIKSLILLFTLLISFNSYSAKLEINKEHSSLQFTVDYMTMIKVEGRFKSFTGIFDFDKKSHLLKNVEVKIDSNSLDTNEAKRDFHLKTMDFLFTSKYPEMLFHTTDTFTLPLNKNIALSGELEIRGVKKRVAGKAKYKGTVIDPWGKENHFFEFNLKVNRKDFKMNWNKKLDQGGFLVGDMIDINIFIQAQNAGQKTSFSTHMIPSSALEKRKKNKK